MNLESGAVDWLTECQSRTPSELQSDAAYRLMMLTGDGSRSYYLGFDVGVPAPLDMRMHQALGYG
jgi:hypothetical protein